MRVVFFGSGEFAVLSLRWLANSRHELVMVVTQPDRPAGRGKQSSPTPVAARALADGLPLERCAEVNAEEFVARMHGVRAEIGVVAAFGQKLLGPLRAVFPSECINLHASLLPKFRGAAPIAWAILAGERKTGVTAFRLVDRLDAGPILVQRETAIGPTETAGELHDRLAGVACDALDTALRLHEGQVLPPAVPQDEAEASLAPKLDKTAGYLDFSRPAAELSRRCRAMWPWPGARCRYVAADGRSEEVTIEAATAVPAATSCRGPDADAGTSSRGPGTDAGATPQAARLAPGTITEVLTVATGAGALEIHSLQPAGKRVMSWQDFVNGRHVRAGDRFAAMTQR